VSTKQSASLAHVHAHTFDSGLVNPKPGLGSWSTEISWPRLHPSSFHRPAAYTAPLSTWPLRSPIDKGHDYGAPLGNWNPHLSGGGYRVGKEDVEGFAAESCDPPRESLPAPPRTTHGHYSFPSRSVTRASNLSATGPTTYQSSVILALPRSNGLVIVRSPHAPAPHRPSSRQGPPVNYWVNSVITTVTESGYASLRSRPFDYSDNGHDFPDYSVLLELSFFYLFICFSLSLSLSLCFFSCFFLSIILS
jgi:hypothetical protein